MKIRLSKKKATDFTHWLGWHMPMPMFWLWTTCRLDRDCLEEDDFFPKFQQ
jgi:hypothetical protein